MSNRKRQPSRRRHDVKTRAVRRNEDQMPALRNSRKWHSAMNMFLIAIAVVLCTLIVFVVQSPSVSEAETIETDDVDETLDAWSQKVTNLLWQVDSEHPISVSYEPEDLTALADSDVWLCESAAQAFEEMVSEMDLPLYAAGGYVSGTDQQAAYDEAYTTYIAEGYSEENAQILMEDVCAAGGQDEHQLGFTVDVCTNAELDTTENFSSTEQAEWLKEYAWEYGFVCQEESGFSLRYVGDTHADVMHSLHLSFDDYLKYLKEKGTSYIETETDVELNLVIYYTDSMRDISRQIKEVSSDNDGYYVVVCYQ